MAAIVFLVGGGGFAPRAFAQQAVVYGGPTQQRYGGGLIAFLAQGSRTSSSAVVYNGPGQVAYSARRAPQTSPASQTAAAPRMAAAIAPQFERQDVAYAGNEKPGTLVVDTQNKFLFLVEAEHRAFRYGVGVGRPGFDWSGVRVVTRKAEWPTWTPPADMRLRRPSLPEHMPGGPDNPLGARALYLGSSLYRIHGTNEPQTIGQDVSSGCIRLMNADIEDLYDRVKVGAKVVIIARDGRVPSA